MTEQMGYQNAIRVFELSSTGRLAKPRGGKITINSTAMLVLEYMALNTYDWPPTDKLKKLDAPCRYYTLGWRSISTALGMTLLSVEQVQDPGTDVGKAMKARASTAQMRISQAWKFLQGQGLIKRLTPASLGRNAGYLLLLGDDSENRAVEAWARQCLNLP